MLKVGYLSDKYMYDNCPENAHMSYNYAQTLAQIPSPPLAGIKVPRQVRTGSMGNGIINSAVAYSQLTGQNTQQMVDMFVANQNQSLRFITQQPGEILPVIFRNNAHNGLGIAYQPPLQQNQFAPPAINAQPRQPELLQAIADPNANVLQNLLTTQGMIVPLEPPRPRRQPSPRKPSRQPSLNTQEVIEEIEANAENIIQGENLAEIDAFEEQQLQPSQGEMLPYLAGLVNQPGGVGSPLLTAKQADKLYREKMGLPALGRRPGSKGKEKMKAGSMVESVVIQTDEGSSGGLIVGFPELQYNPTPMPEISVPAMGSGGKSRFTEKVEQVVQQFTGFFNPQIAQVNPYSAGDLGNRPITPQGTPAEEIDFIGLISPTKPQRPPVLGEIRQAFVGGRNRVNPEPDEDIRV